VLKRWAKRAGGPVFVFGLAVLLLCSASASSAERSVVGHSLRGRPIVLVRSGAPDPAGKLLVVGNIHGDEPAGSQIAQRLIAAGAPQHAELLVVPTVNPDGRAAHSRGNAHGVDLNRNFPFDWQPLIGGEYSGTGPLSEPESRAAHRLILLEKPDVTIWFHQPFGVVDRPAGNPFSARRYSQLAGLPLVRLPGPYPGSASRWQNHALPRTTAFVVELPQVASGALVRCGTKAVLTLAAELASPEVGGRSLPGR
jgi:murein peptide amidase A